jgi:hypothetical protein
MPLSDNDIKSELSYAYLHAVTSRAGCECEVSGRHSDGMGVDARVHVKERFSPDSLTRFTVETQLKATSDSQTLVNDRFSFWLRGKNYDELRDTNVPNPQLLIVLFLPANSANWLEFSEEGLIARKCAYWLSLYDAPSGAPSGQTVYIPRANVLSVETFRILLARFARKERLRYAP